MARVALLIGTGDYSSSSFKPLPAALENVQVLAQVLRDPQIGSFDDVVTLSNPQHSDMAETIETWFRERQRDDLALLFITGHGVKDAQRNLYFAASNTRKQREELITATAVSAEFVHTWTRQSKSKSQIVILDCCFSGAFGNLLTMDDDSVDLEGLLKAEGRVVLTSSSSLQYSFAEVGKTLSVYTQYLVEGLQTGAADLNEDGAISVEEMHQFVSRKVQEVSPDMTPKIIVLKDEGFRLRLANAPLGDPKLKYRKEVETIAQEGEGEISFIDRACLDELREQLSLFGLTHDIADTIETSVFEPFRQRKAKEAKYRDIFRQAVQQGYPLSEKDRKSLLRFQQQLSFRDEDVAAISAAVIAEIQPLQAVPVKPSVHPPKFAAIPTPNEDDNLDSEKGIDYSHLRDLLRNGNWRDADQETNRVMLAAVGREVNDYIRVEEIKAFPCTDLRTIDQLWVNYSDGKFGFSVQKQIWIECGRPMEYNDDWETFGDHVGWRKEGDWLNYDNLILDINNAPTGEFPLRGWGWSIIGLRWEGYVSSLLSRIDL